MYLEQIPKRLLNTNKLSFHQPKLMMKIRKVIENLFNSRLYVNAKVAVVGDAGVGKSGLCVRIAEGKFRPTQPKTNVDFYPFPIAKDVLENERVKATLTLWDLPGQPDYFYSNQLLLDDADVVLLVFDYSKSTDPLQSVSDWAQVLEARVPHTPKYLVSARSDVSLICVEKEEIDSIVAEYNFNGYVSTSAVNGEGIDDLVAFILNSIQWGKLNRIHKSFLFKTINKLLSKHKKGGNALISENRFTGHLIHPKYSLRRFLLKVLQRGKISYTKINKIINFLQSQGEIYQLEITPKLTFLFLRPELINEYTASIVRMIRRDHNFRQIQAIPEHAIFHDDLPFNGQERLDPEAEKNLLEGIVYQLDQKALCIKENDKLIFPDLFCPSYTGEHPPIDVAYQFSGNTNEVYSRLIVYLSNDSNFTIISRWRDVAEWLWHEQKLGITIQNSNSTTGELGMYFASVMDKQQRPFFIGCITDYLKSKNIELQQRIPHYCPKCHEEVPDQIIKHHIDADELNVTCQVCNTPMAILHSLDQLYTQERDAIERDAILPSPAPPPTPSSSPIVNVQPGDEHLRYILHLSDMHIHTENEAISSYTALALDLKNELEVPQLHYIVISGDIGSDSTEDEYSAAVDFCEKLSHDFTISKEHIIVVPGECDISEGLSKKAYKFHYNEEITAPLSKELYIPAGVVGKLVRNEELYLKRFNHFSKFFCKKLYKGSFPSIKSLLPIDPLEKNALRRFPDDRILFLALNSCVEIDHHYTTRANIDKTVLSNAIGQLIKGNRDWLKIVVLHHPVSKEETLMNTDFLQELAVVDFKICMHGHNHKTIQDCYEYDNKRRIDIIGAGTFGAAQKDLKSGVPWQYSLLVFDQENRTITVKTRKKERSDGAWSADARWGDANDPKAWYSISLQKDDA